MADRPITFSGVMVRAMLADLKTQTRRGLVLRKYGKVTEFGPSTTPGYDWHFRDKGMRWHDITHARLLELLPYQIGDRLYVREHWCTDPNYDDIAPRDLRQAVPTPHLAQWAVHYVATGRGDGTSRTPQPDGTEVVTIDGRSSKGKFRQAMHMPKWASRITLHVTEVRVQRLNEIGHGDCMAEGVRHVPNQSLYELDLGDGTVLQATNPFGVYHQLMDRLHGDGFWASNPWVTATTFEVELCHIDQARSA